jgi:glutamate carboxypeptidase
VNRIEQYLGMASGTAQERVLNRARRYVEIETPSGHAAAIAALGAVVAADLAACDVRVTVTDVPQHGVNLQAQLAGDGRGNAEAPIVVLAHIDTVHPLGSLAARPFRIDDGRAYGPGIYDMKTGLALTIEALHWLHDRGRRPRRPIELIVTCDEEIGSHSSRAMIEEAARRAAAVLVPEPCLPDGGVKTFRKGVATYQVEARGRAAHAGIDGTLAVSATAELVHALAAALQLADHARGTTINVGLISGGTASNVVAAEARAVVDVRIAEPDEGTRVDAALLALQPRNPQAELSVWQSEERPPLVRTDPVARLYRAASGFAAELGVDLTEGGTGGGSDGSFAGAVGAATLDGLGAQGGGAHADDEHIVIADLPFRLALLATLFERL